MGKKEVYLFIAGTAIETTGMGLGMSGIISTQWGIGIAVLGGLIFLYAVYRFFTIKPVYPTWQELQARGEAKRWYLDPLKTSMENLIDIYGILANKAITYSLIKYNEKYFRIKTQDNKGIMAKLTANRFWINNRYYKELKNSQQVENARLEYQKWFSNVTDKRLRKELDKLWKCEHQAKSNDIFYEIERVNFSETLTKEKLQSWQRDNTQREYKEQLNKVYTRIKELLGGVPDEQ